MSMVRKKKIIKSSLREQDPHLDREKQKYDNPLPSREFLLEILQKEGAPMTAEELGRLLDIRDDEWTFFTRRLRAMEREGEVVVNRKGAVCIADKLDLIRATLIGHRDGFGFARPEDGGSDLFLSEREMRKALHGDRVMVRESGTDRRGRREGTIVEVIDRVNTTLVGRLHRERGVLLVVPEDRRINQDLLIEQDGDAGAEPGQVVVAEIVVPPTRYAQPIGRVREILGNYADPGMEIEIALRKHALPYRFPDEAVAQAKDTPKKVRKKDHKDRVDLRDLPLVTIDGETARDFDDAVYAEKAGKGWRLIVAIADVSHYVEPGDALDVSAYERGNSVYFPRRVIPMLPEALSNGICSLNPDVERLCMVCDMQVTPKGEVKRYQFYPAVMQSKARLTYNQVWDWIESGVEHPLKKQIDTLYALFQAFRDTRAQRGAIDFDTVETQMVFNDDGKIDRIVPVVRNEAHKLIEECMLAANVCSADFLLKHKQPCLYRVHEGPTPEKLENLRNFLRLSGLSLGGGDKPGAKDYALLAEQIKGRPDSPVLQTMLLRSLQQAVYTPDNLGHFGLAFEAYTHFTSPIRRYPDLLVHRSIKAVLQDKKYKPVQKWAILGQHCSTTERRADEATRDVESWLKCYYMRDKVGSVFSGTISAVTAFGIFVLLKDVYVEGLLHISELGRDYFHYRQDIQSIVGEKSGVRYALGDPITVKVARADLESAQIDFVLAPQERNGNGNGNGKPSRGDTPSSARAAPVVAREPATGKPGRERQGKQKQMAAKPAPVSRPAPVPPAPAKAAPVTPAKAAPAPAARPARQATPAAKPAPAPATPKPAVAKPVVKATPAVAPVRTRAADAAPTATRAKRGGTGQRAALLSAPVVPSTGEPARPETPAAADAAKPAPRSRKPATPPAAAPATETPPARPARAPRTRTAQPATPPADAAPAEPAAKPPRSRTRRKAG
ncbi:ribonuclease R [Microvirgula aerodenitrificans]|uniref:ribonuclease R n=1 Tax=Microvirgula aerodenitrificans TaxID=57480 RepID=UPI00357112A7